MAATITSTTPWEYKVVCIGAGYVGGCSMAVLASKCPRVQVTVIDVSAQQVKRWNSPDGPLPVYEPGLLEIVKSVRDKNLFFITSVEAAAAMSDSDMIFLAVNTPTKQYGVGAGKAADLSMLEEAVRQIAQHLQQRPRDAKKRHPTIIVEKSTVPVRTAAMIRKILTSSCQRTESKGIDNAGTGDCSFEILSNPEFLAESTAVQDLLSPDRVIIGGDLHTDSGRAAIDKLACLYKTWIPAHKILTTDLWSSELSKLASNAFLAQRVSSINSLSAICEATGADVESIARNIGADSRVGPAFLKASVGFGGSCFQKDILNLVYLAESLGLPEVAAYWNQVVILNAWQKRRFAQRIVKHLFGCVAQKKIAVFGFAFKKNTSDTRDTPAADVVRDLLHEHAIVEIYDPVVSSDQILALSSPPPSPSSPPWWSVSVSSSPIECVRNAHALVLLTDWDEFKTYDYQAFYDVMAKPACIFDGKNMLRDKTQTLSLMGFTVCDVGR